MRLEQMTLGGSDENLSRRRVQVQGCSLRLLQKHAVQGNIQYVGGRSRSQGRTMAQSKGYALVRVTGSSQLQFKLRQLLFLLHGLHTPQPLQLCLQWLSSKPVILYIPTQHVLRWIRLASRTTTRVSCTNPLNPKGAMCMSRRARVELCDAARP